MDETAEHRTRAGVRWRDVGIGVLATVLVLALTLGALVLSLPGPGEGRAVTASPATRPPSASTPPDLEPGQTWFAEVDLTTALVATGDGPLRDVHARGREVLVDAEGVRAGWLEVAATVPFDSAAEQIGDGVSLAPAGGGLVRVTRSTELLGRDVTIAGTGSVDVEDGQLVIVPRTVDLGPDWLSSAVSGVAERLVTVRHTVEGVPEGTQLRSIAVRDDGFAVRLDGRDVELAG